MKICSKCNVAQPTEEYRTTKSVNVCRECQRKQRRHAAMLRKITQVQEKEAKAVKPVAMPAENWTALEKLLPELKVYCRWLGHSTNAGKYQVEMQDVLQQAVLNMLTSISQPPAIELKVWALRILRNTAITHIREYRSVELDEEHYDVPAQEAPDWFRELEEQLPAAVARLPARQQKYMLDNLEGLSYQVIADKQHISIGCVKSSLHVGRKSLKKLLSN